MRRTPLSHFTGWMPAAPSRSSLATVGAVALAALPQIVFTVYSAHQLRYEEFAESIRNVWWLAFRQIYDGASSNIGWYGTLLLLYQSFGFSLFAAKAFRLALHVLGLLALAGLLRRYLPGQQHWLPLLTMATSPSVLWLNTQQTSYGIDFQLLPIALYLCLQRSLLSMVGWAVAMIAWMSYPTFVFYLPPLVLAALWARPSWRRTALNAVAFGAPLLAGLVAVEDAGTLFLDESTYTRTGMFRGAGTLTFGPQNLVVNLKGLAHDLFDAGSSYNFELAKPDFSDAYPVLACVVVAAGAAVLLLRGSLGEKGAAATAHIRVVIGVTLVALLAAVFVISMGDDPSELPGLRRYTTVLVGFYALFAVVWADLRVMQDGWFKRIGTGACALLLLHHVAVLPANVRAVQEPSPYRYEAIWFDHPADPRQSIDAMVSQSLTGDLRLVCPEDRSASGCRYSEVYAAVAGQCRWNGLPCRPVYGWDPKLSEFVLLTPAVARELDNR